MTHHLVHEAVCELHVPDAELGRRLTECVSRFRRDQLFGLLERVMGEVVPESALLSLDRLELDLGELSAGDFEREFAARLEQALRRALAGEYAAAGERGLRGESALSNDPIPSSDMSAGSERELELLERFAHSGSGPWWADAADPHLVCDAFATALEVAPRRLAHRLARLRSDPAALPRLAHHLDRALLVRLLRSTASRPSRDAWLRASEVLLGESSPEKGPPASDFERKIRTAALELAALDAAARESPAVQSSRQAVLRQLAAGAGSSLPDAERSRRGPVPAAGTLPGPPPDELEKAPGIERTGPPSEGIERAGESQPVPHSATGDYVGDAQPAEPRPGASSSARAPEARSQGDSSFRVAPENLRREASHRVAPENPPSRARRARHTHSPPDELVTHEGGLVLLWPFLPRFFTRLELLDDQGRFVDERAQARAVALLAHEVWDIPAPPEYQVPLSKLLCGLEPDALVLGKPLTELERTECESLLRAAKAYTVSLKSMSSAQFRSHFIQRPGLIGVRTGCWLLQVGKEAQDLLLEQLPWSWDWVKLPWMPTALQVQWA